MGFFFTSDKDFKNPEHEMFKSVLDNVQESCRANGIRASTVHANWDLIGSETIVIAEKCADKFDLVASFNTNNSRQAYVNSVFVAYIASYHQHQRDGGRTAAARPPPPPPYYEEYRGRDYRSHDNYDQRSRERDEYAGGGGGGHRRYHECGSPRPSFRR